MAQETNIQGAEVISGEIDRKKAQQEALERTQLRASRGFYRRAWGRFTTNKVAVAGLIVSLLIVLFAVGAPLVSRITGYNYWEGELGEQFVAPFQDGHVLGTDPNGRDVLVRLAYGGRVSMLIAGLSATVTLGIGAILGALAGYFGGFIDSLAMRFVDVMLSIPGISLLLLVSTLYHPSVVGLALVIAFISWPGIARLVRGEVLGLRSRDYVEAARVIGASNSRIIFKHIMPNVVPIMVVWFSLAIPTLILVEATLSFLGLGVQIPTPSWGNMLNGAQTYYTKSWTNVFIPGFAIYLTVLAINLVGNGLRDALDPRLSD
jgi:ABC-type dipeptide/oligopeptide/nickel transport system permease subunit